MDEKDKILRSGYLTRIASWIVVTELSLTLLFSAISGRLEPIMAGVIVAIVVFAIFLYFREIDGEWP